MADLLAMDACQPQTPSRLPPSFSGVLTPLKWRDWNFCLLNHPDQRLATFVTAGIRDGFRLGFDYQSRPSCRSASRNMSSAREHPLVISEYLAKECAEGRVIGPLDPAVLPSVHVSPFGVRPKGNTGKWRLILDLSAPIGRSINDGIGSSLSSLSYVSVDDAAQAIVQKGRGAILAKVDIRSAYRVVPVHPDDRWMLGMKWENQLFIDTALPFGLRSAPKIFTAVADAIEWIVRNEGVEFLFHYLDDFLVVGSSASNECAASLDILLTMFARLGVPVATEKLEALTFLGIELDSRAMLMRLPRSKIQELQDLLREWNPKRSCTKRELRSLAGKTPACMQGGSTWPNLPSAYIRGHGAGEEMASPHSAEAPTAV